MYDIDTVRKLLNIVLKIGLNNKDKEYSIESMESTIEYMLNKFKTVYEVSVDDTCDNCGNLFYNKDKPFDICFCKLNLINNGDCKSYNKSKKLSGEIK